MTAQASKPKPIEAQWNPSPAALKTLADAVRDVSLAETTPLARLRAIKHAAQKMAVPIRHGFIAKGDVVNELVDTACRHGLLDELGEAVETAISEGLNTFDLSPDDRGSGDADIAQINTPPVLPPLTVDEWLARDLAPPDFLLGYWLSTTSRVLIDGPTGLGKTLFGIQLGMNVSGGIGFAHWRAHRPCRTLYVDGEMSRRLLRERIAEAAARIGYPDRDEDLSGFHILCREDLEDMPPLNTAAGQTVIEKIIAAIGGIDLIMFDSIMCLLAGNPKDPETWQQVMPWVRHHTKQKRGQIWLHHTGLDSTHGYGDKTKEWQLDTVAHMTKVDHPATDVCFTLEFTKARERTPATRADSVTAKFTLLDNAWQSDAAVPGRKGRVSPLGQKFFDTLTNVLAGDDVRTLHGRRAAHNDTWKAEAEHLGLIDPKANPNSARTLFNKHRRELVAANYIACNGDLSWIV